MSNLSTTDSAAALATAFDAPDTPVQGKMPWIKFFSDSAKGVTAKCEAAGVKRNSFYFEDQLGVQAVSPMRVHLMKVFRFKARIDQKNAVVSTRPYEYQNPDGAKKKDKYIPGVVGLMLAQTPAGLQVACGQYLSSLCTVFKGWESQMAALKTPELTAARGSKWADAAKAVYPPGRFTLTMTGYAKTVEGYGDNEGEEFTTYVGDHIVNPTSRDEVEAFNKYFTDATTSAIMIDSVAYFARLVDRLMKLNETKYDADGQPL